MRGAWIEILIPLQRQNIWASLPMRGAWIEISVTAATINSLRRRSPCGERGLKSEQTVRNKEIKRSLPMRGAWIEIERIDNMKSVMKSLPMRGAWIEILFY